MAKARVVSEAERQAIAARRNIEQIVERKKRTRERGERAGLWSRRDFFGRLSWGGLSAVSLVGLLAFIRSAFPRVLFLPPTTFDENGEFVVDKGKIYTMQPGVDPDKQHPESILKV